MRHHNTWRAWQQHMKRCVFHTGFMALTLFWFMIMQTGCFERRVGDSCAYTGGHESTSCDEGVCVQDICREPAYKGDPCIDNSHCVKDDMHCYREEEGARSGVCHPLLNEGDTCRPPEAICDIYQGLFCYQDVCTPPQPEGAGCLLGSSSCQEGLYCIPPGGLPFANVAELDWEAGTCKPGQGENGLCSVRMQVGCAAGYICSTIEWNTCQLEGTTR